MEFVDMEMNLCNRGKGKCCPSLIINGKLIKKYKIVDDDGTTIKFKKDEILALKDFLNKVL